MIITSPLRNTTEIAIHLRKFNADGSPNRRAALEWLDARKVPTKKSGRDVVAHIDDINAALEPRKHCELKAGPRRLTERRRTA